jgi:hypothetical protein
MLSKRLMKRSWTSCCRRPKGRQPSNRLQSSCGLSQLDYLDLRETNIADGAFGSFKKLTNLRALLLPTGTWLRPCDLTIVRPGRITASGFARIQKALPNWAVYYRAG